MEKHQKTDLFFCILDQHVSHALGDIENICTTNLLIKQINEQQQQQQQHIKQRNKQVQKCPLQQPPPPKTVFLSMIN